MSLHEAEADPRIIFAVDQKLKRNLLPPSVLATPATDASAARLSRAESDCKVVGGSVGREYDSETFM